MEIVTPTKTVSPDEEAILGVLNHFMEGWNLHNVNVFAEVFDDDADFTNVMGVSRSGKDAIIELHAPLFKTIWSYSNQRITGHKIRFIKPDVAAVDARWTLEGLKDKDGGDRPPRNGLLNFVMTKKQGRWSIAVMHNMDLPGSGPQKC